MIDPKAYDAASQPASQPNQASQHGKDQALFCVQQEIEGKGKKTERAAASRFLVRPVPRRLQGPLLHLA